MFRKKILVGIVAVMTTGVSLVSAASANTDPPVQTELSQFFLDSTRIILTKPSIKPDLSEADAIKAASNYFMLADTATSIHVEYQLMTSDNGGYSETAKAKNAQLKRDGHLNHTPVYIVTFKGVSFRGAGGAAYGVHTEPVILHENHVVVDANSGEVLFSFSYS